MTKRLAKHVIRTHKQSGSCACIIIIIIIIIIIKALQWPALKV